MLHTLFKKIMLTNSNTSNKSKAPKDDNKKVKRFKGKNIPAYNEILSMDAVEIVSYSEAYWKMLEKMVSDEVTINNEAKQNGLIMADELCEIKEKVNDLLATEHILQAHIENMENLHREKLMGAKE